MMQFQATKLDSTTKLRKLASRQPMRVRQPVLTTATVIGAKSVIAESWETISFSVWIAMRLSTNPTSHATAIATMIFDKGYKLKLPKSLSRNERILGVATEDS